MGAYSASKAAVEALGNTLRQELRPSGARVGVAYFAELDTDMTTRGFNTDAARKLLGGRSVTRVTPLEVGIRALERGIARRSRVIVAPAWTIPALPGRTIVQLVADRVVRNRLADAVRTAQHEEVELTTPQPGRPE
jgi:short-subunit dehydrogenase